MSTLTLIPHTATVRDDNSHWRSIDAQVVASAYSDLKLRFIVKKD